MAEWGKRQGDIGKQVIIKHFGRCGGDPYKWDARRLAVALWINEIRKRFGGEPVTTRTCIGEGVDPAVVYEMAREALELALETLGTGHVPFPSEDRAEELAALDPDRRVYFIQAEGGGPIKIGSSLNVSFRLAALQSGSPLWLRVLIAIQGGIQLENWLHRRFAAHRLHGEWFAPAPELLAYIEGLE